MNTAIPEGCRLLDSAENITIEKGIETYISPDGTIIEEEIKFFYIEVTKNLIMPKDPADLAYQLAEDCLNCPLYLDGCNPNIPIEPFIELVKDLPTGTEIEGIVDFEPVASKGIRTIVLNEFTNPENPNAKPKLNGSIAG